MTGGPWRAQARKLASRSVAEAGAVPVIAWAWWRGQPGWARAVVLTGIGLAAVPWVTRGLWVAYEWYARYFDLAWSKGHLMETLTPVVR